MTLGLYAPMSLDVDVFPEADPMVDRLHLGLRRFIGPRRTRTAPLALDDVVELHAVRALQIVRRLGRDREQLHADCLAWKVAVAVDFQSPVAAGDHLALPGCGMGHGAVLRWGRF